MQLLRCACKRREDEQGCCKFEGVEGKMKKLENGKGVNELWRGNSRLLSVASRRRRFYLVVDNRSGPQCESVGSERGHGRGRERGRGAETQRKQTHIATSGIQHIFCLRPRPHYFKKDEKTHRPPQETHEFVVND